MTLSLAVALHVFTLNGAHPQTSATAFIASHTESGPRPSLRGYFYFKACFPKICNSYSRCQEQFGGGSAYHYLGFMLTDFSSTAYCSLQELDQPSAGTLVLQEYPCGWVQCADIDMSTSHLAQGPLNASWGGTIRSCTARFSNPVSLLLPSQRHKSGA